MGGPTRFMNHSCEPNCRQFAVAYNNGDPKVYDLAFFAIHDIPAYTELTFDYLDAEDEEAGDDKDDDDDDDDDGGPRLSQDSTHSASGKQRQPCLCGADNCRRWLWR